MERNDLFGIVNRIFLFFSLVLLFFYVWNSPCSLSISRLYSILRTFVSGTVVVFILILLIHVVVIRVPFFSCAVPSVLW